MYNWVRREYGITRKFKMAALEDITAELSRLANDFSCAELSHGEIDLNIHELYLLWQSIL